MGGPFMPGAGFQALGQQACVGATPFSPLELKLKDLYQTVVNYVFDGRILSGPFMSLPTRLELPIYYEVHCSIYPLLATYAYMLFDTYSLVRTCITRLGYHVSPVAFEICICFGFNYEYLTIRVSRLLVLRKTLLYFVLVLLDCMYRHISLRVPYRLLVCTLFWFE